MTRIAQPEELPALWRDLAASPAIALDTESDQFHAYNPQVCLIQIATATQVVLLDPLQLSAAQLAPLGEVLGDSKIEVVMHGADNDVLALDRDFNLHITNLFDTMIAARFLGVAKPGLGNLLRSRFDVNVSKRFQRLNWRRRPLPGKALDYAALDVAYLLALRDQLSEALRDKGLLRAVEQSGAQVAARRYEAKPFDPDGFWRIKGAKRLRPEQLAILRALYLWRHDRCDTLNQAALFIASDSALITLARHAPRRPQALHRVRALQAKQRERFGGEILSVIDRARDAAAPKRPKRRRKAAPKPLTASEQDALTELRTWRKNMAAREGLAPSLIAPNQLLTQLVREHPTSEQALLDVSGVLPWHVERFGTRWLEILSGSR